MDDHGEPRDYLKLHFLVFLWGFTGVLGELIDLPPIELVFYRCLLSSITLGVMLRHKLRVPMRSAVTMFATGAIIGLHWVLFFLSIQIANVSVCMVGAATISLWTALLEPIMIRGRVLRRMDLVFGGLVIAAVAMIFQSEMQYALGFTLAIAAAMAAAVFSIINGVMAKHTPHRVIVWYQLTAACLFCTLCLPISARWLSDGRGLDLVPSPMDWVWLLVLAEVCTVYAHSEYVSLLKRLSVFTTNFANNLEPVYGIILAGLILGDYHHLSTRFYVGAGLIALLVLAYTGMSRRKRLTIG